MGVGNTDRWNLLTGTHERADEEQHGPELGHALVELLVRGNVAEHGDLHLG